MSIPPRKTIFYGLGKERWVKVEPHTVSVPQWVEGMAKGTMRYHWFSTPKWLLRRVIPINGDPDNEEVGWYFADDPEKRIIHDWEPHKWEIP